MSASVKTTRSPAAASIPARTAAPLPPCATVMTCNATPAREPAASGSNRDQVGRRRPCCRRRRRGPRSGRPATHRRSSIEVAEELVERRPDPFGFVVGGQDDAQAHGTQYPPNDMIAMSMNSPAEMTGHAAPGEQRAAVREDPDVREGEHRDPPDRLERTARELRDDEHHRDEEVLEAQSVGAAEDQEEDRPHQGQDQRPLVWREPAADRRPPGRRCRPPSYPTPAGRRGTPSGSR